MIKGNDTDKAVSDVIKLLEAGDSLSNALSRDLQSYQQALYQKILDRVNDMVLYINAV